MAETSGIAWTHSTFNAWIGCQKVSPGCDHCYAETLVTGRMGGTWGPGALRRRTSESYWRQPYRWNRKAALSGQPWRVFCCSLADVFDNAAPEGARDDLWRVIRETPALTWLLLTKRPQNIVKMLPPDWGQGYANVWLGTTVENHTEADRRIPHLLAIPARVRFLSCEPLLGPVDLSPWWKENVPASTYWHPNGIHWVIAGGESGSGARPMHPAWARALRDQCAKAGVPFFFKQTGAVRGEWPGVTGKGDDPSQWPAEFRRQEFPT